MSKFGDITDDVTQVQNKVRKFFLRKSFEIFFLKKCSVETCFVLENNFENMTQKSQISEKNFVFSLCSSNSVPC